MRKNFKDRVGLVFGRLTVMAYSHRSGGNHYWQCKCTCGSIKLIQINHLISGQTMSCGCLNAEHVQETWVKHGESRTPLYSTWKGMFKRCQKYNVQRKNYADRGITVSEEFRDWPTFRDYVCQYLGERPSIAHSIDRINNDQGYERGNLRWATRSQQANNRRNTALLTIDGITKPLTEWADSTGVKYVTLYARLRRGLEPKKALLPLRQFRGPHDQPHSDGQ